VRLDERPAFRWAEKRRIGLLKKKKKEKDEKGKRNSSGANKRDAPAIQSNNRQRQTCMNFWLQITKRQNRLN
jgi:hypothetical protein